MVNPGDLVARRARLATELARLDELIAALSAYASEFAPELLQDVAAGDHRAPKPAQARNARPATTLVIQSPINTMTADVVAEAMAKANRPLTLAECESAVRSSGVQLPDTKNPKNVVGTRLHRSGRFRVIQGLGWWFADRPLDTGNDSASYGAERNEAPSGDAEGASETEEVAASSIDNRPGFRLVG